MQKRVRKCYGYREQKWLVEEFRLAGGDGVPDTPDICHCPGALPVCPNVIRILGML